MIQNVVFSKAYYVMEVTYFAQGLKESNGFSPVFEYFLLAGVCFFAFMFFLGCVSMILSILNELFTIVIKVIRIPMRLFLPIVKSYKSQDVFSKEDLDYIFHNSINKEMYVGDLLERLAFMKKKKEPLRKIRREMLKQIFIIKINSIKMKIENMFSNKKMKIDD